jgi:hypothetical protein
MIFRCSALLLSLAFAGAPLVADYCAVSCEAAHMDGAAASTAHAGHHHGSTALFSISQPPQPCGHDHNGVVGIASSDGGAPERSLAPGTAVTPALPLIESVSFSLRDLHGSSPPPGTSLCGIASPLRI